MDKNNTSAPRQVDGDTWHIKARVLRVSTPPKGFPADESAPIDLLLAWGECAAEIPLHGFFFRPVYSYRHRIFNPFQHLLRFHIFSVPDFIHALFHHTDHRSAIGVPDKQKWQKNDDAGGHNYFHIAGGFDDEIHEGQVLEMHFNVDDATAFNSPRTCPSVLPTEYETHDFFNEDERKVQHGTRIN